MITVFRNLFQSCAGRGRPGFDTEDFPGDAGRIRLPGRAARLAALLLCGGLVFCAVKGTAWAAETPQADLLQTPASASTSALSEVSMTVNYGYDDSAKGGRYLPVRVAVESRRAEAIAGKLEIRTVESDGSVYQYDFPADLKPEGESLIREYVPLGTRATQLYVRLLDADGSMLCEEQIRLNVNWDVPELFIGVLSDEPQALRYLDGVGISRGSMRTRTFDLSVEDFPAEERGLNLLDVLVVNNYRLRNLSTVQTTAIMDWVKSGGTLVLGTGERVDDTLGRFAPELLDDSYTDPNLQFIDLGESYHVQEEGAGMLALTCVDIPLHGGNVILSSNGLALVTVAAREKGLIGVAAFDLADISQFCEKETSYVDYLLTEIIGESRIRSLGEVVYNGNSSQYTSVQGLINTGNVEKLPNLPFYAGVALVYLFLLGPGLYLFLKNRGLQIYYRRGVMILSGVFAVGIYLAGSTTRFSSTFYTYASVLDSTENYLTDTTYLNIRTPYSRPFSVRLDPDYSVLPITRIAKNRRGAQETQEITGSEDYQICVDRADSGLTVRGQDIAAFMPLYFRLEKKTENADNVGITGSVRYFEGEVTGTITNNFPYPLDDVALVMYGSMIYVGSMEPGQSVSLDSLDLLRYPLDAIKMLAGHIAGTRNFTAQDIGSTDYLLAMERASLLEFYLSDYLNGYTADARVIAFSDGQDDVSFLKEEEPEACGLTMLTSAVAVNAFQDNRIYRSVLMKTPTVVTGRCDTQSNTMRGTEPLTLEYWIGADIRVESLTFEPVSAEFADSADGSMEVFTGTIYFYNHSTGNYDEITMQDDSTLDVDQLRPYLSPGNSLTVRYVYEGTGNLDSIQLPMPMVAGREV